MYELDKELYTRALQLFDRQLAGECANVTNMILKTSKDVLDEDVTIAVGWVEINGNPYFKTDEVDETKYFNERERYNYHVWLEGENYFIDLTLVATLRDMNDFDDSIIPENIVCIGMQEKDMIGIIYHLEQKGDDVLVQLHKKI